MAPAGRRSRWRPEMSVPHQVVFFTGATGLVGGDVLRRMLAADPALRAVVLVRDAGRWEQVSTRLALPAGRVGAVVGDVTRPGLGLSADTRVRLAREITAVVHAAADVVFSRPLAVARAVNVAGVRHLLDVAAIAVLALRQELAGRTLQLCAGSGALPVDELLDVTWRAWSRRPEWRRRGIPRPVLTDIATYHRFELAVEETGDPKLRQAVRALSYFAPQLALPKAFDTRAADAALGWPAPAVRTYWARMLEHLVSVGWCEAVKGVAA